MKISVIMPYYNSEPWIRRCIESMKQNTGNFEFLLIDDHSTDNSCKTAKEVTVDDDRFILLANEHNKGVSGARNTGIDHASGEWVIFVDADDEMAPAVWGAYKSATNLWKSSKLIQFNHRRDYRSGIKKVRYTNPAGHYSIESGLPQLWEFVTNKLYNRDLIGDIRFKEDMSWGEDEMFNIECIAKNDRSIDCVNSINFIHHFDNLKSLTKTTTAEMLLKQAHVLEEYILKQEDIAVRRFVCYWLGFHWQTAKYLDIIGGKTE